VGGGDKEKTEIASDGGQQIYPHNGKLCFSGQKYQITVNHHWHLFLSSLKTASCEFPVQSCVQDGEEKNHNKTSSSIASPNNTTILASVGRQQINGIHIECSEDTYYCIHHRLSRSVLSIEDATP